MTMRTTVRAAAKINLFLDITGKRSDGYHIVNMVMQSVSLYDEVTVTIEKGDGEINVSCTDESIPCDETNTAYQAVKAFFEYAQIKPKNVWVKIKKRIPSQAGMAGGSTDASAVLVALNEMLDTGFSQDELAEIAEHIGADVPFCIYGGTMTASGIGTILTPLPEMPECYIVVVKPDIKISTKEAYEKKIMEEAGVHSDDMSIPESELDETFAQYQKDFFERNVKTYMDKLGNVTYVNIPGNHSIFKHKPEEVSKAIGDFLDKLN